MGLKILLFLEHTFFITKSGEIYCEKVIDNKYLERYFNVFDNICICARVSEQLSDHYIKEPLNNVSILPLPNYNSNQIMMHFYQCYKLIEHNLNMFDGAIIRGPSSVSFLAYEVLRNKNIPFITELVINPESFFKNKNNLIQTIKNKVLGKILINHTKKMCRNANGVAYVTEKFLQKKFPSHCMIYGESNSYFDAYYSSINLEEEDYNDTIFPHIEKKDFVICHTGWMVGYSKGHKIVIDTAKMLIDKGYPIVVKFIGDGPLRKEFENYSESLGISSSIHFLGQKNSFRDIQDELSRSHLFLFPSINEGLPRALIEAMANSLACVSTDSDGIPELLDKEYLVSYSNIIMSETLVEKFINDEQLRIKVAKRNFKKAQEYRKDVLMKRRSDFYMKYKCLIQGENK